MFAASLMLTAFVSTAPPQTDDVEGRFGEFVTQVDGLQEPVALAFGGDGRLFVVERGPGRVVEIGADGRRAPVAVGLDGPRWIAVEDGRAAVEVEGPPRLLEFDLAGPFETWTPANVARIPPRRAAARSEHGWALRPAGQRGVVWVPDADGVDPEQVATRSGAPLELSDPLLDPVGLAPLPGARLAVVDAGLHELLLFDGRGELVAREGGFGHFPGQLSAPSDLTLHGDRLYLADTQNHRVQVRGLDGALLYEWGKHALRPRQGEGHLHYPSAVAIARDGSLAAVLEPFEGRVQLFGPAAGPAARYRTDPMTLGAEPSGHFGLPVAAAGRYAITLEPETQEVHVHDLETRSGAPVLVGRAGGYGEELGRFRGLVDVAFDGERAVVWALDRRDRELTAFDLEREPDGEGPRFRRDRLRLRLSLDLTSVLAGSLDPVALAVLPDGGLLVADGASAGVARVAFDAGGAPEARWLVRWSAVDRDRGPSRVLDLVADGDGALVVGDRALWSFADGAAALTREREDRIGGLALDAEGGRWWTDRTDHRLVAPAGPIGGGPGLARLEFTDPRGVALTGDGRVVVVDHGNHRLQVLSTDGAWRGVGGPRPYVMPAVRSSVPIRSTPEDDE